MGNDYVTVPERGTFRILPGRRTDSVPGCSGKRRRTSRLRTRDFVFCRNESCRRLKWQLVTTKLAQDVNLRLGLRRFALPDIVGNLVPQNRKSTLDLST